jgi:hypothetical protein
MRVEMASLGTITYGDHDLGLSPIIATRDQARMIGQYAGYGLTNGFGGTRSNNPPRSGIDVYNSGMCVCDNDAGAHAIDDRVAPNRLGASPPGAAPLFL